MSLSFSHRHGLVLGATCDLGVGLSRKLIQAGLFPVLTCRTQGRAQFLESELSGFEGQYATRLLDFAQPQTLDRFMESLDDDPQFLVDLAQGDMERFVGNAPDEEIFQYVNDNIAFRAALLKRVTRTMLRNRQGRLVFVSSIAAIRPNPGQGFYAAAKLASEAIYRNVGLEMGARGITTVSLRPGFIDAGRGKTWLAANPDLVKNRVPIARPLTVNEVADAILYLLSDSAAGMNGVEINMDGGMSAGK